MTGADARNFPIAAHRPVLAGVQYLRGWAALLVVLSHVDAIMGKDRYFGAEPIGMTALIGIFGVAVFFAISGFIIALVSLDARLRPKLRLSTYARRRFERILPFLWICVIGYNVLYLVAEGAVEWLPALRAFFVWPVGEMRPNVVWSLRHELLFYILFAVTVLLPGKRVWLLVAWCVAPLIAWPFLPRIAALLGPDHAGLLELYQVVFCGSLVGANLQFGAGLLLATGYLRGASFVRERMAFGPWLCLGVVAAGAMLVQWTAVQPGVLRALLWTGLSTLILLVGLTIRSPRTGGLHRLGLLLGNASFAIYLTHNPLLLVLLEASRLLPGIDPRLFLAMSFSAAVAGGVLIHLWIESPLLRLLGKRHIPVAAVDGRNLDRAG